MTLTPRTSFAAPLAVGLLLLVGTTACGSGDEPTKAGAEGSMSVRKATIDWPANPSVAAVRMVVRNGTSTPDALVGVSSPIATSASIHRSETDAEGRATMTPQDNVAVPPRSSVTFEPGGLHVMLTGITDEIAVGDDVPLTLTFEHAAPVTTTATVIEPGTAMEGDDDH